MNIFMIVNRTILFKVFMLNNMETQEIQLINVHQLIILHSVKIYA